MPGQVRELCDICKSFESLRYWYHPYNPGQSTGARRWKVVMKIQGLGGELNSSGVDESLERFASGN
ncbi:hypothetical protein M413DRAFT_443517 [Hebeloma cylindrosporum]|uniref:Uncharacterized protein n=1 Tax=Hebeloma cylindrosporum TaxID=76867 RepID=A0A0C3CIV7_HEBCY|nr:hypothetical protein M413DRAFT_443517 [Hebeloma cylindrosporum h7]